MSERQFYRRVALRHGAPVFLGVYLAVVLYTLIPAGEITHWLLHPGIVAGLCWAGQFWYVLWRPGMATAPRVGEIFGVANGVTITRGGLYAVVAGFVVIPPTTTLTWVPAVCYGAGAVLDRLDGVVARTVGQETRLGARLDMAFDTFGFVVAPLVAVRWGLLPAWYLSLSAARYVYLAGIYRRRLREQPVFAAPDSNLGRYLAGVQMLFLTVALAPSVAPDIIRTVAPLPLVASLSVFARDFLVVSGRLGQRVRN